jgi:hypothetical protein
MDPFAVLVTGCVLLGVRATEVPFRMTAFAVVLARDSSLGSVRSCDSVDRETSGGFGIDYQS